MKDCFSHLIGRKVWRFPFYFGRVAWVSYHSVGIDWFLFGREVTHLCYYPELNINNPEAPEGAFRPFPDKT